MLALASPSQSNCHFILDLFHLNKCTEQHPVRVKQKDQDSLSTAYSTKTTLCLLLNTLTVGRWQQTSSFLFFPFQQQQLKFLLQWPKIISVLKSPPIFSTFPFPGCWGVWMDTPLPSPKMSDHHFSRFLCFFLYFVSSSLFYFTVHNRVAKQMAFYQVSY